METVSKKNETETEEVRILREETKKALKTLYSIGTDAEEFKALPLSECTRAAIYARRKVSDALESLFVLHRILYCVDDEASANKILDAARGMENIANEYIIASIEDKMGGNWKGDMIMETEELIIDTKNLYVQGLIKVINDFMLEEASDCFSPEDSK